VLALYGHKVQALSAEAGEELWSYTMPAYPVAITTADNAVYVAAMSNPLTVDGADQLYAFQA
jgi:outer membrane protein assembly factor BamB